MSECVCIHTVHTPTLRKANHRQCLQWLRALFSLPWGPLIEARIPSRVCVFVCESVGLTGIALDKRDALASSCGEDSSIPTPPKATHWFPLPLPASLGPVRQLERRWCPLRRRKGPSGGWKVNKGTRRKERISIFHAFLCLMPFPKIMLASENRR